MSETIQEKSMKSLFAFPLTESEHLLYTLYYYTCSEMGFSTYIYMKLKYLNGILVKISTVDMKDITDGKIPKFRLSNQFR